MRAEDRDDDERPLCQLTKKQGGLFDAFYDAAKLKAGGIYQVYLEPGRPRC